QLVSIVLATVRALNRRSVRNELLRIFAKTGSSLTFRTIVPVCRDETEGMLRMVHLQTSPCHNMFSVTTGRDVSGLRLT
ncbi:hypothetical protein CPAR01_08035, partial [Colletotrichum paranaense]